MKKTLFISSIIAASSAFATTVTSSNSFGLMPVSHAQKYTLVAVPYTDYNSTDIKVNQLIKTSNLSVGDKIYISNGTNYDVWEIVETSEGKVWQSITQVTINANGAQASTSTDSSEQTLSRGNAFWLYRANPTASNFYLMGQPPATEGVSMTVNKGEQQMLANSKTSALQVSSLAGENGDVLNVPGESGSIQKYVRYNGNWCTVSVENFITTYTPVSDSVKIPAGVGFFYNASGQSATTRSLGL